MPQAQYVPDFVELYGIEELLEKRREALRRARAQTPDLAGDSFDRLPSR